MKDNLKKGVKNCQVDSVHTVCAAERHITLPIAEILSGKNGWAWVAMVLYLKENKLKY